MEGGCECIEKAIMYSWQGVALQGTYIRHAEGQKPDNSGSVKTVDREFVFGATAPSGSGPPHSQGF